MRERPIGSPPPGAHRSPPGKRIRDHPWRQRLDDAGYPAQAAFTVNSTGGLELRQPDGFDGSHAPALTAPGQLCETLDEVMLAQKDALRLDAELLSTAAVFSDTGGSPFRIAKTFLEGTWGALRLRSGVVKIVCRWYWATSLLLVDCSIVSIVFFIELVLLVFHSPSSIVSPMWGRL